MTSTGAPTTLTRFLARLRTAADRWTLHADARPAALHLLAGDR